MAAGYPYFAWIDVGETTFTSGHMRWDEDVFSFTLSQDEGDPASLTLLVRRPRNSSGNPIGLLGPGRKIWCWFSFDCGPALIKFRGRLVGIPTNILEELVTLEFIARPVDVVAQKEAIAATLRVLPFYDEVVLDEARRTDPEVVLEGYTKIWHYDRESHVMTVSDEINGEDGTVEFDGVSDTGKVLYDGLGLSLTSGPLARVDVAAEFTWTQQGRGTVDLTNYLTDNWPGGGGGAIYSYTMGASDWPKVGAGLGDGWVAAEASAYDLFDYSVYSITRGSTLRVNWPDGSSRTTTFTSTTSSTNAPFYIPIGGGMTDDKISVEYDDDGDGGRFVSSFSHSYATTMTAVALQGIRVTLVAGYSAARPCTERVSFTLFADVQSILTEPEDGEAYRIDDVRSVNLSEPIGEVIPIGDTRRRSYIATERGNRSLEHLILLARAHLMKRARVVEIAFAPKLSRMPEITLRKNAVIVDPRLGEALGKIIGYSIALNGADGRINCEVSIGCAIGRGGAIGAVDGTPTYCSTDYAGADYQQFISRIVLLDTVDTSVGYQPPNANPNDDGIELTSVLRAEDVIERELIVDYGADEQEEGINAGNSWASPAVMAPSATVTTFAGQSDLLGTNSGGAAQAGYANNLAVDLETRGTFKLKSMTRTFATDYPIQVTDLKIPPGYDLEAV